MYMLKLYTIKFRYHSRRDWEDGIKEMVVSDNDEHFLAYVSEAYFYGDLYVQRWEDDAETEPELLAAFIEPAQRQDILARSIEEGTALLCDGDSLVGSKVDLVSFLRNNYWDDLFAEDGDSQYDWSSAISLTHEEAATLFRLGIAKDLRGEAHAI
jgi:hypothetical protein